MTMPKDPIEMFETKMKMSISGIKAHKNKHWGYEPKLINLGLNFSMGYVIGTYLGDGYLGDINYLGMNVKDKDFRNYFVKQIENIGGHCTVWEKQYPQKSNFFYARISSVILYNFIKNFNFNQDFSEEFKRGFLKGFFDSEGSTRFYRIYRFYKHKNGETKKVKTGWHKSVTCFNTKKEKIDIVTRFLDSFNINYKVHYKQNAESSFNPLGFCYSVCIFRNESLKIFNEKVGFSIQRKQERLNNIIQQIKDSKEYKRMRRPINKKDILLESAKRNLARANSRSELCILVGLEMNLSKNTVSNLFTMFGFRTGFKRWKK